MAETHLEVLLRVLTEYAGKQVESAMAEVQSVAWSRNAARPRFESCAAFLDYELLFPHVRGFDGSLFEDDLGEMGSRLLRYVASSSQPMLLIELALERLMEAQEAWHDSDDYYPLRILRRMGPIRDTRFVRVAKPLAYYASCERGIAVALATFDDFWTDRW